MKRLLVFLAMLGLVFMVSCGDGNGGNSGKKQGELYGACYPNKTCNEGLVCDEENDVCLPENGDEDSDADTSDTEVSDEDTGDTEEPDEKDDSDTDIPVTPDENNDSDNPQEPEDNDIPETPDTDTPVNPEATENHKISGTVQAGSASTVALVECGKTEEIASANTGSNGKFSFNADISAAKTYCVKAGDFASCFKGMSDHVANISEITTAAYLVDKTCADLRKSETKIRTYAKLGTGEWLGELDYSKLSGISEGLKLLSSFIGSTDSKTLSEKIAEDAKKESPEFSKLFNGFRVVSDKAEIVIGETADSSANFSVEGGSAKVAPNFKITWTLKNKSAEAATYKFTTSNPGEYVARAKLAADNDTLSSDSATVLFLQKKNGGTVYVSDTSKNISFRIDDGIYGVIPKGTVVKKNGNKINSISYEVLSAGGNQVSRLKFRPEGATFEGDSMYFVHELGTVFGGDPIMLSATRTNADGSVDVMNSAAGDPIMMAAAGDPIMTTAAGDPIMQAAAGDPIMNSAAGDPIMTAAAGDPIMTSAAGDPIMNSAAGDPIMSASAGDPIMSSAAGDPIMTAAAGDPIMMGTSSSAMISQTSHYSTFTVEAASLPVSVDALVARWCDGSFYRGYSPVKFIKEGFEKYKPESSLLPYLDCDHFSDLGNDLYELMNKPVGYQRNLNLFENLFFVSEFYNRMNAKRESGAVAAVKNGLELRSAIAALYTATTSYNRSTNMADLFDSTMIPLTYNGTNPKDYTAKAKAALTGNANAADRYAATKKEMMIFANYITTSSKGPDFNSVSSVLNPDQLVCAWFNPETMPQNCNKVYTINDASHVTLGGTEVSVAEANAIFTKYFMPFNSRLNDEEKLHLFRTLYLALKYAGTIFYNGTDVEELNDSLLETAYLVFDGIDSNANAVSIVDSFDASAHTVSVLDGNEMAARPYLTKLSALTDKISLKVAAESTNVEKVLINIEGKEFEKVQENTRTYYTPKGDLKEKSIVLTPGTLTQGEKALKELLGSENVDSLGSITGKMTIVANSKISGKTYTTQKSYDFFVNNDSDGVNSKPVPANIQIFVNDSTGHAIAANANPTIILNPGSKVYYPTNGVVSIENLTPAAYTVDAFADGYYAKNVSVNVPAGATFGVEIRLDEELTSTADANLELKVNINTAKHPSKVYIQIYNDDMDLVANETAKFNDGTNKYENVNIEMNSGRYTLLAVGEEMYRYLEAITLYEGSNEKTITVVAKNACGNGIVDSAEECEPSVEGSTLEVLCGEIYPASTNPEKTATCDPNTCTFNKTDCGKAAYCGDGIIDAPSEGCDGGAKDCSEIAGFGNSTGSAPCASDCSGYITANNCSKATAECGNLPANAVWNDGSGRFNQKYDGADWLPAAKTAVYGDTKEECVFSCAKGYKWNGSVCEQYPLSLAIICTGADGCSDNTNETECPAYGVAFFGQDVQYAEAGFCTPHNFTTSGTGNKMIVTDAYTHYEWLANASGAMDWADAEAYCANYENESGSTAVWRLPSPTELLSIVDSSTASPALNDIFTTANYSFWATGDAKNSENAWIIDENGALTSVAKTNANSVICVRVHDYDAPENRFTATAETVKDNESGLMWQKQAVASRTWAEALNYCGEVSTDDKFDWRLPNRNELASLINYEKVNGAVSDFPAIAAKGFWTSTASANETAKAWTVDFESGAVEATDKTNTKYIICVRNDEPCFGDECPNACGFNACKGMANSTGLCTANDYSFTCGCKSGFNWNHGKCLLDTTRYTACTGLPENAIWNTVFGISQTYDGDKWYPSEAGSFNKIASSTECRFICATNYKWDADEEKCLPVSRMTNCSEKKPYSDWNVVSKISQTWDGEKWQPSAESVYNTESSEEECRFICKEHYNWDSENNICDGETQPATCIGLPANAHWWNDPASITQKWTNGGWAPAATGRYNDAQADNECYFGCDENYEWNGTACAAKKQTANCEGLPDNAEWTGGYSTVQQTWNGLEWYPNTVGSYNTEANSSYCRFKCKANYNWNGSTCAAATQIANCTGLLANAQWNTVSSIKQTYVNGNWMPTTTATYQEEASDIECHFKCKEHYEWKDGECKAGTKPANACTGLPANAQWVGNTTVEQTWNGTEWTPSTEGHHQSVSTTGCVFTCKTNYNWSNGECKAATQNGECTGLPANAQWNGSNTIQQTWNGSTWLPELDGLYSESSVANQCRFKCRQNYTWNGTSCEPRTQIVSCGTLPGNAAWNTVSQIKQTWNGSTEKWEPAVNLVHNDTSSETECRYTCKTNYEFKNGACVAKKQTAACTGLPANAVWNSSTVVQEWNGTMWAPETIGTHTTGSATDKCYFKCIDEGVKFDWDTTTSTCKGHTKSNVACDNNSLPANASWWNANINQTWSGSEWLPTTTGSFSNSAVDNQCRFKCNSHYSWNGATCEAETKISSCGTLPANAEWNTASSIEQHWDESASGFTPTLTPEYGTEATTAYCRFKCKENYEWKNGSCQAKTKTVACTGLPANAVWRTSSSGTGSSFSITQRWSGTEWTPSTTGTHGSFISGQCRFTCADEGYKFKWENNACLPNTITDQECEGLPDNAEWTGGFSTISQTWNPATNSFEHGLWATFATEADSAYCHFKCKENYTWTGLEDDTADDGECVADTRTMDCKTLPENAVWNYVPTITQTWDGKQWLPKLEPKYNVVGSESECLYICDAGYYPLDGKCVGSPCDDYDPCSGVDNANGTCLGNGNMILSYACECNSGYYWWGRTGCRSQNVTLGNLCPGTMRCYSNDSEIGCPESQSGTGESYNFYGQDAYYEETGFCVPKNFSVGGTVSEPITIDNATGLKWTKNHSGNQDYSEAKTYCSELTYGGETGWRLPSIKELMTIFDNSMRNPAVDTRYFDADDIYDTFWSITEVQVESDFTLVWTFSSSSGSISQTITLLSREAAICVKGTMTETPSFTTVVSNAVVKDSTTELYWQKDYATGKTWQQALEYCENLTLGGYDDWRLPNYNELASIIDFTRTDPAANPTYLNIPTDETKYFWTSTTRQDSPNKALAFDFKVGLSKFGIAKSDMNYVRCVRSDLCGAGKFLSGKNCVTSPCTTSSCSSVANSDGVCIPITETTYSCGCADGYTWESSTSSCIADPCITNNECISMEGSDKICTPDDGKIKCGCVDGYFWNGSRCMKKVFGNICTGQQQCYNGRKIIDCPESEDEEFFGQDAYYASKGVCTPQSFIIKTPYSTKPDEKVVLDENTKLEWQRTISGETYTFYQAVTYCANLEYAGYDDWRLPTTKELASIMDQRTNAHLNTDYFSTQVNKQFWTSKRYVSDTNKAWTIDFGSSTSNVIERATGDAFYAVCVRGEILPESSFTTFTKNGDSIIKDNVTGLMWQYLVDEGDWSYALNYCKSSTYGGYTDWRLPNINELLSIVNYDRYRPTTDIPAAIAENLTVCSSTTNTSSSGARNCDRITFSDGSFSMFRKTGDHDVLCVR